MSNSKRLSRIEVRMPVRAPRICGFLKDLAALARAIPSNYRASPRIYGFLKDLAAFNRTFWRAHRIFPSKHRASSCIYGFLKDLGQVSTQFTGTRNHGD